MNFTNKAALITGGTGALGQVVAQAFLQAGGHVFITYTRETEFDTLKTSVGARENLVGIKTNVLDEASVKVMMQQAAALGRIDVLVNTVGGFLGGVSVAETTLDQFEKMFALNLKSAFLCCKHVFPVMRQQRSGRIINIGSQGGLKGGEGIAAYGASKAGLINFTQTLAAEGKPHNITANVIIPGVIDTPANRQAMPNAKFAEWVAPASIAQMILFLASDAAQAINGATIPVGA